MAGIRLMVLPEQTLAMDRFNRKLILDSAYLATLTSAAAQAVIPLNALGAATITNPATLVVGRIMYNVKTPFTSSGGAITTLTLSLGDGSSATRFLNAIDLKTAAQGVYAAQTNGIFLYTAADTIDIVATIAGQTMASLNAGLIEIALEFMDPAGLWTVGQP